MSSVKDNGGSPSLDYLEEQSALFRKGGYWNCLVAARRLSELLLAEGRSPFILRLRKTESRGDSRWHAPLTPRALPSVTWTTHYVCCCDQTAYDPVAGRPLPLDGYGLEVFGDEIPSEIFVAPEEMPAYLASGRLLRD